MFFRSPPAGGAGGEIPPLDFGPAKIPPWSYKGKSKFLLIRERSTGKLRKIRLEFPPGPDPQKKHCNVLIPMRDDREAQTPDPTRVFSQKRVNQTTNQLLRVPVMRSTFTQPLELSETEGSENH